MSLGDACIASRDRAKSNATEINGKIPINFHRSGVVPCIQSTKSPILQTVPPVDSCVESYRGQWICVQEKLFVGLKCLHLAIFASLAIK